MSTIEDHTFIGFPGGRFIGDEELEEVAAVIRAQSPYRFYGLNLLERVSAMEALCCEVFQRKHALAVSSGTAALHCALFALGVGGGDEVILPAYAWSADLMAILALGAVPVIAPLDDTLGLDPERLAECITDKIKVIIAVHMRGQPCDILRIREVADRHSVALVEDGAQCIGGVVGGLPVGATGDCSVLSLQFNKLITCGEGGVVLTDDLELHERAQRFHDLGMLRKAGESDPRGPSCIATLGLNYRLSELQAAFLMPQIRRMNTILEALARQHQRLATSLAGLIQKYSLVPRPQAPGCSGNHAFLCLQADAPEKARECVDAANTVGIGLSLASSFDPHTQYAWTDFLDRNRSAYRVHGAEQSNEILKRTIVTEVNPHLTEEQLDEISELCTMIA